VIQLTSAPVEAVRTVNIHFCLISGTD